MSAADRFIAGEDRLSALLRELPAYAPSDALAASVRAAARAAQQEADLRRASAASLPFPAPPTLAAAVLEEAARLQAAQAARRDAVLARVASGEAAEDVLGAPVSEAASEWLQAQASASAQETARKAAQQAAQSRLTHAARARRWWRSLGLVASVAAVAGLTTSIVLRQIDDGALLPAATSEMSAPAPAPLTEPSPETAAAAPVSPPPPAAKAAPPPRREARQAPASEDKPRGVPAERSAPRESVMESPASAQVSPAPSPAAPAIAAAPPAPADSAMAEAAPAPPPLPAPAAQAGFARKAAPPVMASRAPAGAAASAAQAMTVSIQEDPAGTAARLGTGTPLGLWAAEPDNAEIREWAERLWQAMPAGQRPPAPYAVQADRTLAPGQVRIELRREVPQGAPQ